jgi:hypothetical protein
VTSVLQTTAGKMIFGRFIEPPVAAQPVAVAGDGEIARRAVRPPAPPPAAAAGK